MKKLTVLFLALTLCTGRLWADEGMWLLPFLGKNMADMKAQGLKLTAEDIYSVNKSALKDAIIIFGRGCTGEIVSDQGLILTNHHCGFGSIQQHSTVEHDYLKDGFWAMNQAEEIPTPGLSVKFVKEIRDVSAEVFGAAKPEMTTREKNEAMNAVVDGIIAEALKDDPTFRPGRRMMMGSNAEVKSMFGGNQYILFVYETFDDVRLVGAPPTSIGKFGGDTDNWMWPRHTGDFSMFRVYATKDGKPAAYSKDNVPYKPKAHLKVSLKGYKPGDFAMIIGFPGSTDRYMTSFEIDEKLKSSNPNRIYIRGIRQDILAADMAASDKIRIQYASKFAQSSNYWKNSIGESRGLEKLKVKEKKQALEARFTEWVNADPARKAKYGDALHLIQQSVEMQAPYDDLLQYLGETMSRATELLYIASMTGHIGRELEKCAEKNTTLSPDFVKRIQAAGDRVYKDYSPSTDRKVAKAMFKILQDKFTEEELPSIFKDVINKEYAGNVANFVDAMYDQSIFTTPEALAKFLANPSLEVLENDLAVRTGESVATKSQQLNSAMREGRQKYNKGHRLFIAGLLEMEPEKLHYPDANSTIRLTYGQVLPYDPQDGVTFHHFTTLKGVMDKEDLNNPIEFTVPTKLKELYKAKDFGPYAENGDIHVGFLSNNDITGGNSGSPILNAKGELLGLAFDGNWEAMSGDITFEPELQRTINVDIRYVLFVIDKFAGAKHLVDEMTLVTK